MAQTVDELTFNYEDDGQLVRKEIKKAVLSKGAWATLMFMYQELDRKSGEYRPPKVSIVRFKKASGVYRKQSSFNISNEKQARQIVEIIEQWYGEEAEKAAAAEGADAEAPAEAAPAEAPAEAAPAEAEAAPATEKTE